MHILIPITSNILYTLKSLDNLIYRRIKPARIGGSRIRSHWIHFSITIPPELKIEKRRQCSTVCHFSIQHSRLGLNHQTALFQIVKTLNPIFCNKNSAWKKQLLNLCHWRSDRRYVAVNLVESDIWSERGVDWG